MLAWNIPLPIHIIDHGWNLFWKLWVLQLLPTAAYPDNPATSFTTEFVHPSTNKVRCSINQVLVIFSPNAINRCTYSVVKLNFQIADLYILLSFLVTRCWSCTLISTQVWTISSDLMSELVDSGSGPSWWWGPHCWMLQWTPTGRRLITGSQSGEFTLWNGQSFNFEMILQVHVSCKSFGNDFLELLAHRKLRYNWSVFVTCYTPSKEFRYMGCSWQCFPDAGTRSSCPVNDVEPQWELDGDWWWWWLH